MAKQSKTTSGQTGNKAGSQAGSRKARREEVAQQYGEILYSSEFSLSPHLENEMASLYGPANAEGVANLIAGLLCAAIVLILMASQSYLPIALVFVVGAVVVMAMSHRLQDFRVRTLSNHGYNAGLLTDEDLFVSYVTKTHVVVERPIPRQGSDQRALPAAEDSNGQVGSGATTAGGNASGGATAGRFDAGRNGKVDATSDTGSDAAAPSFSREAYSLSDLRQARSDGNNCVASFGKGRAAFFTRRSMGGVNFSELVEFLGERAPATAGESFKRFFHRSGD